MMKRRNKGIKRVAKAFGSLLPALTVFAALFVSGDPLFASAAFAAAALHEVGHILAAEALGIRLRRFSFSMLGARLLTESGTLSYPKEALLAAAGPAANLLGAAYAFPLVRVCGGGIRDFCVYFLISCVFLALLNLLPIKSFDGGRILYCLLAGISDVFADGRPAEVFSFLSLFCLWSISVYFLLRTGSSLSLFVFSSSLFLRMTSDDEKQE